VLIPLLFPKQITPAFLLQATLKAKKVFLLEVIESSSVMTAPQITARMQETEQAVDGIKKELHKRGIITVFSQEWGSWDEKIKSTCQREKIKEVVVPSAWKLDVNGVSIRRVP